MDDHREMVFRINCDWRGQRKEYRHAISRHDLDEITPFRAPLTPAEAFEAMERAERRRRFVDMLSSKIAHAMTNALLDDER